MRNLGTLLFLREVFNKETQSRHEFFYYKIFWTYMFTNSRKLRNMSKSTKDSLNIPYLMFINDCLIFYRTIMQVARKVTDISEHYNKVLRQLIDYHKSKVRFSASFSKTIRKEIADILHILAVPLTPTLDVLVLTKGRLDQILVESYVK